MAKASFYATGRRKEAVARVWIFNGQKGWAINGRHLDKYLTRPELRNIVMQPLRATNHEENFRIRANVQGGGMSGQAGAIRLGIARALVQFDEKLRSPLRQGGFLTRDPREKERKKFGQKGARKNFQYTKR